MKLGLLGRKLSHTVSPAIHAKVFTFLGIEGAYSVYETEPEGLPDFVRSARENLEGFNVTIPYKTDIMQYMDGLSEEAEEIGAVNTVHVKNGVLTGYNTDYFGFGHMLGSAGIEIKGKTCCVLGSGGAARAAAIYLRDAGARVAIASRDAAKAKENFKGFEVKDYGGLYGDVLVNTTPVGMYPDISGCPVDRETIAGFKAVADIIYNPRETVLIKTAREMGLKTADGMQMLVAQAVKAEEIWQGGKIDDSLISRIAEEL